MPLVVFAEEVKIYLTVNLVQDIQENLERAMESPRRRCPALRWMYRYFWMMLVCIQVHQILFASSAFSYHISTTSVGFGCPFAATQKYFSRIDISSRLPKSALSAFHGFDGSHSPGSSLSRSLTEAQFRLQLKSSHFDSMGSSEIIKPLNCDTLDDSCSVSSLSRMKPVSPSDLQISVVGVSHHQAGVSLREKLAIPEDDWNVVAGQLCEYDSIYEAAILSTCNRLEIYLAGTSPHRNIQQVFQYLHQHRLNQSVPLSELREHMFLLTEEDAVRHLLRVSGGLESLVVGEGQILSQVKRSYEHGVDAVNGYGGKVISKLLNTAVTAGKRVRTETGISKGAVSISSAAVEFARGKPGWNPSNPRVVILGAGKMSRLLLIHLQSLGISEVTVVNRTPEKIDELRKELSSDTSDATSTTTTTTTTTTTDSATGTEGNTKSEKSSMKINGLSWTSLLDPETSPLLTADFVFPSTAALAPYLTAETLSPIMEKRGKTKNPLRFVDISVPRNVAEDCQTLSGVECYNVDDLKAVVAENTAKRKREVIEAELLLQEEQVKYRSWRQSLGAVPTITKLQEKAEQMRLQEMNKVTPRLASLSPEQVEVVNRMTKGIVAKLLHGTMSQLRASMGPKETEATILQVQKAFRL